MRALSAERRGRLICTAPLVLLLLALLGPSAGCKPPKAPNDLPRAFRPVVFDPTSPNAYFVDPKSKYIRYQATLAKHHKQLPGQDHRDYAMLAANRAMICDAAGNTKRAGQAALDAQAIMAGIVKGEEGKATAAAIADESAKVFKGESYESAMLNCFVGLCNLQMGDYETAAIGFRRALDDDKMSKEDQRDDFHLAYWGLGMADLDRDAESARMALKRSGYKSQEIVSKENVVFVVSMGRAPSKQLTGLYGEYDTFAMANYEPRSVEVFVDDVSLGKGHKLIDLYRQSQGVPRTGKDVGQGAKAVGKFALAAVVGAFLGSSGQDLVEAAWSVKADTRTCYMLPNEVHAISGRVSPGLHTVRVKFYNAVGAELRRYEQMWHHVPAPKQGRNFIAIRSEFDRCNVQGPIAFTKIKKVKTKTISEEKGETVTTIRFRAANLPSLKIGDKVRVCHFYRQTENRWDMTYHWRYAPMAYNNKGEPIGHPGAQWQMQDYDIGIVGEAEVVEIKKGQALATVISLTTGYLPNVDDLVTKAKPKGRLWQ